MKTTVNEYQFREAFHNMGRSGQFSYNGLHALFEYLSDLEDDIGEEFELDVIALCCDFTESTLSEVCEDYGQAFDTIDDALEWLQCETSVILVNDASDLDEYRVIYQAF